jgi:hypothetical protein
MAKKLSFFLAFMTFAVCGVFTETFYYTISTHTFEGHNWSVSKNVYAGALGYKNDPNTVTLGFKGPLPPGTYNMTKAVNHPDLGIMTIVLDNPEIASYGRDNDMRIHGASKSNPIDSSRGCIILPRDYRQKIVDAMNAGSCTLKVLYGDAPKSGLRTDGVFGALPAIYADYNLATDSAKAKRDKAREKYNDSFLYLGGLQEDPETFLNMEAAGKAKIAYEKAEEQYKKEKEELEIQFRSEKKAEWARLDGNTVTFKPSAKFDMFTVGSVKIDAEREGLTVTISNVKKAANMVEDITKISWYSYKFMAKHFVLDNARHIAFGRDRTTIPIVPYFYRNTEKWVDFDRIEFVANDE